MIYLDNNATTRPSEAVVEAVMRAERELWANPSSVHRAGQAVRREVELARRAVAELIGARAREVTFTGSGTEAVDLAIRGSLAARRKRVLVTDAVEHAAVRDLATALEGDGVEVRWLPVGADGVVDVAGVERVLGEVGAEVGIVSVQWANNETGAIQPIGEIGRLCREARVPLHCDATQWVGKMPTDVGSGGRARGDAAGGGSGDEGGDGRDARPTRNGRGSGGSDGTAAGWVDVLTFAPHKFHGPKGVGVLWARRGARLRPVLHGSQELGRRGGTENVPGIVGAGVAAGEASAWLADPAERERLAGLRDRFESLVVSGVPDAVVNGPRQAGGRLWNTSNIGFPGLEAEALLLLLSEQGVCASAGAACSSGSLDPSPVLLAMGVPEAVAHGSVRFSLSRETTEAEVEEGAAAVVACVERLRRSSSQTGGVGEVRGGPVSGG